MKIRVLGGFGSEQPCCGLTGFLINEGVVLDAGTISTALTIPEQAKITHVILSHAHLDHTKALPFMLDNIAGKAPGPVEIMAAAEVIETLHAHIFNNQVWPDFSRIPSTRKPVIRFRKLVPGREVLAAGLRIKPVRVNHTVPTTGFIISDDGCAIVYSGDTKATEDIWKAASKLGPGLKALFVETSFPNRMQELADRSGHLTPRSLGVELKKVKSYDGPVFVYHVKSQYLVDIERELDALGRKDIIVVRDEMEWEI